MATTNNCDENPLNPYCNCYVNGEIQPANRFKQFNNTDQTNFCCDRIRLSLAELRSWNGSTGDSISAGPLDFFQNLWNQGMTGCCYLPYFQENGGTATDSNFEKNYPGQYHNFQVVSTLYNNFLSGSNNPPTVTDHTVSCPSTYYPYIIKYKTHDLEKIYNYAYICNQSQNLQSNLTVPGSGSIDYHITQFHNYSTGLPCYGSNSCIVDSSQMGAVSNLGNSQPYFSNVKKTASTGSIVSLVFSLILLLVFLYALYDTHNERRKTTIFNS